MPSRKIEDCVPVLQTAWAKASAEYKRKYPEAPQPFLTCTHRAPAEQLELYAQGRTKPGKIVTQLKAGSKHNSLPSKAFDIAFKTSDGKLSWDSVHFQKFAAVLKDVAPEVSWGGNWTKFKDLPHFEVQ